MKSFKRGRLSGKDRLIFNPSIQSGPSRQFDAAAPPVPTAGSTVTRFAWSFSFDLEPDRQHKRCSRTWLINKHRMNVQVLRGQHKTIVRVDKEGRERKKSESCRFEPPAAAARHMSPQSPSPEQDNNIQFTTCTLCSLYFLPLQSPLSLSSLLSYLSCCLLLNLPCASAIFSPSDSVICSQLEVITHAAWDLTPCRPFSFLFSVACFAYRKGLWTGQHASCSSQPRFLLASV